MRLLSRFIISRLLLLSEIAIQINIIVESAVASKPEKNTFKFDQYIENSIDQSELAIVIASLFIAFSLLIFSKTKYFLAKGAWGVTITGIVLSIGNIVLRHFESGLYVNELYYHRANCYNTTTNLMFAAIFICIPYGFCKTNNNTDKRKEPNQIATNDSSQVFTHRPHQEEECQYQTDGSIEFLPTYFEMKGPPIYRNKSIASEVNSEDNICCLNRNVPSYHSQGNSSPIMTTIDVNNNRDSTTHSSIVTDMHADHPVNEEISNYENSGQPCATNISSPTV
ncbi:hypothetical protein EDC94DRAFT_122445 [Helicostylum pulchrum]|nr:hypothetical protein EDC94DRAFT_122445 [Helicostylum pulchrum]